MTHTAAEGEITGEKATILAAANAVLLWRILAGARGHRFIDRGSFAAADASSGQGGLRIIVRQEMDKYSGPHAEIAGLIAGQRGRAVVEDPFGTLDLSELGLTAEAYPLMIRQSPGGNLAGVPDVLVVRANDPEKLALMEEVIVTGFPQRRFQPYVRGAMCPPVLLGTEGLMGYLALRGGEPAGGCVTLSADGAAGVHWVVTLPEHRSHGVGRALMHTALRDLGSVPVTLVATEAGFPLYRSLGFRTAGHTAWWRVRSQQHRAT